MKNPRCVKQRGRNRIMCYWSVGVAASAHHGLSGLTPFYEIDSDAVLTAAIADKKRFVPDEVSEWVFFKSFVASFTTIMDVVLFYAPEGHFFTSILREKC